MAKKIPPDVQACLAAICATGRNMRYWHLVLSPRQQWPVHWSRSPSLILQGHHLRKWNNDTRFQSHNWDNHCRRYHSRRALSSSAPWRADGLQNPESPFSLFQLFKSGWIYKCSAEPLVGSPSSPNNCSAAWPGSVCCHKHCVCWHLIR